MDGNTGRKRLAFRRDGSGKSVVLLHGIPGSGRNWNGVADGLSDDHDVIVPDLLGFGGSSRPATLEALHADAQASALADLLDEIEVSGAIVVGHDFGGPIALLLAAKRPDLVSHLGLLATNAFTDTPIPFPLSAVTWPLVGNAASGLLFSRPSLAMMLKSGTRKPNKRLDASAYLGDKGQVRSIRTIFGGSLSGLRTLYGPVEAALKSVHVPSIVVWGDRDPFFPVRQGERTAQALRAPLEVLEGAGHFLPEERPDEVAAAIRALEKMEVAAR